MVYYVAAAHNGGYMQPEFCDYANRDFEACVDMSADIGANDFPDNMSTTTVESISPEDRLRLQRPPSPPVQRPVCGNLLDG